METEARGGSWHTSSSSPVFCPSFSSVSMSATSSFTAALDAAQLAWRMHSLRSFCGMPRARSRGGSGAACARSMRERMSRYARGTMSLLAPIAAWLLQY